MHIEVTSYQGLLFVFSKDPFLRCCYDHPFPISNLSGASIPFQPSPTPPYFQVPLWLAQSARNHILEWLIMYLGFLTLCHCNHMALYHNSLLWIHIRPKIYTKTMFVHFQNPRETTTLTRFARHRSFNHYPISKCVFNFERH